MISFSCLGDYGRFGNQLFQYAHLRTQAKRLGTKFYCPPWLGNEIFDLKEEGEKTSSFSPRFYYKEPDFMHGFHNDAIEILDETEICGFFQSEKYFSRTDALLWFTFKEGIFDMVREKYKHLDFNNSTAIHIRLGDYHSPQMTFYTPKKSYFEKALTLTQHKKHLLVFSDDPTRAKKHLGTIADNLTFIEGNAAHEDFYLMTLCKDIICSPSSFSWWAAYLNRHLDKTIIVPERWFLPGAKSKNDDIFVDGWIRIKGHSSFFSHFIDVYFRKVKNKLAAIF